MLDKYFPLYIFVFLFTFFITVLLEKILIPKLSANASQPIYEEGPSWHIKKKGTPTMGGLAFILSVAISLILVALFFLFNRDYYVAISLIISLSYALLNGLIGVFDDIKKLRHRQNAGLSPKQKLILQFLCAVLFLAARRFLLNDSTEISFSFGYFDLGIFYYPISLIILLGIVNSANLTDGIDGLASSVAFSIGISLFYISAALSTESALLSSALIGATVGFLIYNTFPAKIFMGDTGALFFGSLVTASAFTLKNPLLIVFIAGVYVMEALSVILQVVSYKLFKKRIFKMAPLHHHLEKCGWSENRICIVAIITTFIMSIPAYILYLP